VDARYQSAAQYQDVKVGRRDERTFIHCFAPCPPPYIAFHAPSCLYISISFSCFSFCQIITEGPSGCVIRVFDLRHDPYEHRNLAKGAHHCRVAFDTPRAAAKPSPASSASPSSSPSVVEAWRELIDRSPIPLPLLAAPSCVSYHSSRPLSVPLLCTLYHTMGSARTLLIETPLEWVRRNVAREHCKAVTSGHGLGGIGDAISSFFTAPGSNQQQAERAQSQPQQREPPPPPPPVPGPGPEGKTVNTRITTSATPVATAPASNPGAGPTALLTNATATATANDVNTTRVVAPTAQFLPSTQAAHNRARAQVMNNDALPSPTPSFRMTALPSRMTPLRPWRVPPRSKTCVYWGSRWRRPRPVARAGCPGRGRAPGPGGWGWGHGREGQKQGRVCRRRRWGRGQRRACRSWMARARGPSYPPGMDTGKCQGRDTGKGKGKGKGNRGGMGGDCKLLTARRPCAGH